MYVDLNSVPPTLLSVTLTISLIEARAQIGAINADEAM